MEILMNYVKGLLFVLLATFLLSGTNAWAQESFFLETLQGDLPPMALAARSPNAPTRYRLNLNPNLTAADLGATFSLDLPSGESYTVVHDNRWQQKEGAFTWVGYLEEVGKAYRVTITYKGDGIFGQIRTPEGNYRVQTSGSQVWLIEKPDQGLVRGHSSEDNLLPPEDALLPEIGESLPRNSDESGDTPPIAEDTVSENAVIDLVLLYTPGFVTAYGDTDSALARLNNLVALTNQAYADSQVHITLRLMHTQEIDYTDDSTNMHVLYDLTYGDAPFEDVSDIRLEYGADFVSLVRPYNLATQENCGVGWQLGGPDADFSLDSPYGYTVVSDGTDNGGSSSYCDDYILAHELGHNMGSLHDRDHNTDVGAYSYSFGHDNPGVFATIMSYNSPLVPYFSNPDISLCNGQPCGIDETEPDAANNALSLNNVRDQLADFYPEGAPSVTLQSHINSDTITTLTNRMGVSGFATDLVGVTGVTWSNNRGSSGSCTGTTESWAYTWTCSDISLSGGDNTITISAEDAGGNIGTAILVATYPLSTTKLLASDGASIDRFGGSVSLSGDYAFVGASGDDNENGTDAGAAYIYHYNGLGWIEQQKLLASDGRADDYFSSVSVSGDQLIVRASGDDNENGTNAGAAYIYHYDGTSWVEQQKLLASDGAADDYFGRSQMSGDYLIVGVSADDNENGIDAGAAYIYHFNGTSWVEQQKLLASDGAAGDRFGTGLALSGDYALVGAYNDNENGIGAGAAYVYHRDGTSWVEQQKLLASDGDSYDDFGSSMHISGDYAIIGAPDNYTDSNHYRGVAYIYHYDGTSWVEQQMLRGSANLSSANYYTDNFGKAVSLLGDYAIVGSGVGVYVYHDDGTSWEEQQRFDNNRGTYFSSAVSLSENYAIVGDYLDYENGADAGAAYLLTLIEPIDTDNDGVADNHDAFPDDPAEWWDTDGDTIGNNADLDDDNDTIPDTWEVANGLDPLASNGGQDMDGDGVSDVDEYIGDTDPNSMNFRISGRVTDVSGNGMGGVLAEAASDQFWFSAATDNDGFYTLPVALGTYRVMIWGIDGYQTGFYNNASTWLNAESVTVSESLVNGIDFTLNTGLTISGSVTNLPTGESIQVEAWSVSTQGWTSTSVTGTGATVSFALTGLAAADDYVITTWGEDYPVGSLQTDGNLGDHSTAKSFIAGATDANITLPTGYSISGTISGLSANDIVWIDAQSDSLGLWNGISVTAASTTASYTIANLPNASDYLISFLAEGYQSGFYGASDSGTPVEQKLAAPLTISDGDTSGIDITLSNGRSISGSVSGLSAGQSAWITAWNASSNGWGSAMVDGADGSDVNYSITGLPEAADYKLSAWSDGFIGGFYSTNGIVAEDEAEAVSTLAANVTGINFSLSTGHAISGTITGLNQGEQAWLTVWSEATWSWGGTVVMGTGSAVTYSISGLPASDDYVLTFQPENYIDKQITGLNSANDPTWNFICSGGNDLSGSVSWLPAYATATITAIPEDGGLMASTTIQTDENGAASYTIKGLDPAYNYIVRAESGDKLQFYADSASRLDAAPVEMNYSDRYDIDFSFNVIPMYNLSGTIAGVGSATEVWIDAWDESTWVWQGVSVTGNKAFSLELPDGSYKIGFHAEGYADLYYSGVDTTTPDIVSATAVILNSTTVLGSVTMSSGYEVSGAVYFDADNSGDGDDSEQLASISVELIGDTSNKSVVTNSRGHYTFTGIPAGTYTLSVHSEYGNFEDLNGVTVGPDQTDQSILLGASGMGDLSGTVTQAGIPVANAVVKIFDNETSSFENAISSGSDGGFFLKGLDAGSYTVTVDVDGDMESDYTDTAVDVTDGTVAVVSVTLP